MQSSKGYNIFDREEGEFAAEYSDDTRAVTLGSPAEFLDHVLANVPGVFNVYNKRVANVRNTWSAVGANNEREGTHADMREALRGNAHVTLKQYMIDRDIRTTSTYTVTVGFDNGLEIVVVDVKALDEEWACDLVANGLSIEVTTEYTGPGEVEAWPEDYPQIDSITAEADD